MMFEVCERCFEVFFEASERHSVCISLGVKRKEVFDPVWALYNIKAELGHLSAAHTHPPSAKPLWML